MPENILKWVLLIPFWLSCQASQTPKLLIATAANMQFVMNELTKTFTEETGVECNTIISSSGKLTAQIKEGAPYDLFVSANMKYPNELFHTGFSENPPKIYAYGRLIMWSLTEPTKLSIQTLLQENINHIAIANPKNAPYGGAAIEVLVHFDLKEKLEHKLVYGESIAQTNQFITSGAAEIGFTAKSVVLSPEIKEKGHWETLDPNIYSPIAQGVIKLKSTKMQAEAQLFYDFLSSAKAQDILIKYGYEVNT